MASQAGCMLRTKLLQKNRGGEKERNVSDAKSGQNKNK